MNRHVLGSSFLFVALCPISLLAAPIRIPVSQDNSIVLVDGEWTQNAGQQGRIRIKGNQHLVAMSFDTSSLAGKRIRRAALVCTPSDQQLAGVTISTIAAPWDETKSNGMTAGVSSMTGWGYEGARFPAVTGGNAGTLAHRVQTEMKGGAYVWELAPDLVHALSTGVAYGLAIHEHEADYRRNPTIYAREQSSKKPYLEVELDTSAEPVPQPPTRLKVTEEDDGGVWLSLTAPAEGFAYDVTIDGEPLGRHNIPLVAVGRSQRIPIRDLPGTWRREGTHELKVVTIGRTGQRSVPATLRAELLSPASNTRTAVVFPTVGIPPAAASPIADLAVIPVVDKYDLAGRPVGDLPADYRTHNALFDGRRIQLTAAAGEVVGFQLLLRGRGEASITARLETEVDRPAMRMDLHQALYVSANDRQVPDPLVPLPAKLALRPDADQVVFVDLYVPFDSRPGPRRGSVTISDGRVVPIELTVLPVAIPKRATFLCEMNSYGLPDRVEEYEALQQIAYDHRVHANILHYSHNTAAPGARKSNLDMRLRSGRRMDNARYDRIEPGASTAFWDDFAEAFGRYLDGSLFQNGHRGPIPAPGFYLTFHESWPLHCRAYFQGDPDAYRAFRDAPVYSETYSKILADFARVAAEKGWREAGFQVYFNNKGSLTEATKAPWILDEPSAFWDYRALRYYGELTDRGRGDARDVRIDYRIDISRPEFSRGQLDGRADLWVVSSWAFQNYRRLVTDRQVLDGLKVWVYGSSNHVHETNRNIQAWGLDAWCHGATGLVPWQTVDKTGRALRQADQLGLFIFDRDASGQTVLRHSARLKAYREVQQLIEYLELVKRRRGWSSNEMRRFVDHYVRLDAQVHKVDEADAGTTAYDRLSAVGLEELKRAMGELLR